MANIKERFKELSEEDINILSLFSQGYQYTEVQSILRKERKDTYYDGSVLGKELGMIKKHLNCGSMFDLGYTYSELTQFDKLSKKYNEIRKDTDSLQEFSKAEIKESKALNYVLSVIVAFFIVKEIIIFFIK